MNNITQLRDTINAAYRAVWYIRRETWFYGYRWLDHVLNACSHEGGQRMAV